MAGDYYPWYGVQYPLVPGPYMYPVYPNLTLDMTPFTYQSDAWRVDALEKKVARLERQVRRLRLERVRQRRQRM